MFLSALLRHPLLATFGISAVIIVLAVLLSIVSYQSLGRKDPGLTYEILSALGISALLAPTFLYPWIRTAVKLRQATLEITKLATTDALTGLPNTRVLRTRLKEAVTSVRERDGSLAVLFVDLDRFKQVNETLGHLRGDALLAAAAHRLQGVARDGDLVARFGGDEFVIVGRPRIGSAEAAALVSSVIEALSMPFDVEGHMVVIGATVGIALAPGHGTEPGDLLKNADLALRTAKSRHQPWLFYEPLMTAAARARRDLELELRAAHEKEVFEIHYQPILDLRTMRFSTCEALLRWPGTDSRVRTPAEFIPVAEDMGLMTEIGTWVLDRACRECAAWPGAVRVAVNLSPVQFADGGLVETVQSALSKARLLPDRLELEITESLALGDFAATQATLERLRALGVRIALDDFGTGYSSLSYLNALSLDKVKIDRAFVLALNGDARSLALLHGIAELSAAIGLIVAVEGIETEEQFDAVTGRGTVHEVQGYLFGMPMSDRSVAQFLTAAATTRPGLQAPRWQQGGDGPDRV